MINFICVKTPTMFFINVTEKYSGNNAKYLFDNCYGEPTFNKNWLQLKQQPSVITEEKTLVYCNYELIDKSLIQYYPEFISHADMFDEDSEWSAYFKLYQIVEEKKTICTAIEFNLTIHEIENELDFIKNKYKSNVSLLTTLMVPDICYQEYPNYITGPQLYTIIREYIKLHIDGKYAQITSDYDFCFEVSKITTLIHEKTYTVNVSKFNAKKPKYEIRKTNKEKLPCFRMAPKEYSDYPIIKGMGAPTLKQLETDIENYLKNLITDINTPVKQCECCNGTGYIMH